MEIVAASTGCTEASLALSDFQFPLPAELIAQTPAEERDRARLMVLDRSSDRLTHTHVHSLHEHLRRGDLVVVNDTRVIPARLFGRTDSGAAVEILLIRPTANSLTEWLCLGKPARRLRTGTRLTFAGNVRALVASVHGNGRSRLVFDKQTDVLAWLGQHGEIPLPPYIRRPDGPLPLDGTRYQTIFAVTPGAIAAPTAGLHFTQELMQALQARGIEMAPLTLHVGPGTFLPVRCDDVRQHVMESEWYDIPPETAAAIQRVKAGGGRVVAVGTTTTRALESAASDSGVVRAGASWAELFIVPGHRFRIVDALFTNFHLPGSTLLLLVSAFAGRARILDAYGEAIRQRYRFYSYGDAMLVQ